MLLRKLHLLTYIVIISILGVSAMAGTNIQLRSADGVLIKPSQIENVSIIKTCGDCHDIKTYTKNFHFKKHFAGPNSRHRNCLCCHLPNKNAFNTDGTIKAMASKVNNATCVDCHSDSDLQSRRHHRGHNHFGYREHYRHSIRECIKHYVGWPFVLIFGLCVLHFAIFGPKRYKGTKEDPDLQRFALYERIVHWLAMLCFTFLSISGLLFLLHYKSAVIALRSFHGEIGIAFVPVLIAMIMIWWRQAIFTRCDGAWIRRLGGYLWINADCPAGKFNAGQKIFFWVVVLFGGFLISGSGLWLFIGHGSTPAWVYTLHDIVAIALIVGIIGHVYLAIFANPGTIMSIISGRVKRSWAEKHHSEWAKKLRGE